MLVDARRDGEDVRVEDDVLRLEPVRREQLVGTLADFDLALGGVGLANFIEGHDHHSSTVGATFTGEFEEGRLAFLHADRIDDRLSRHALQACLDHAPLRAVDHDRDAGDVRLGSDSLQENRHRLL